MAATSAFTEQVLSERLSKLNNSQQSIETLSHWCIFHRKRAKQVVQTWHKDFLVAPNERKISFLYLANDILQNSRKKGNEFVSEFYKVMPSAVQHGVDKGGEKMAETVKRLIDIWTQRKVFGTKDIKDFVQPRGGSAKTEQPTLAPYKPPSYVDKIAAQLRAVEDAGRDEDDILKQCNEAITEIQLLENPAAGIGVAEMSARMRLRQANLAFCMERMEKSETRRSQLVASLKEVLGKQEVQLERVRTQLQIAQAHAEQDAVFVQEPSPPILTSSAPTPPKDPPLSTSKGSPSSQAPVSVSGGAALPIPGLPRASSFKDADASPLHEPPMIPVSPVSDTDLPTTAAGSTSPEPPGGTASGAATSAPPPAEAPMSDKSAGAAAAAEVAARLAASSSSVSVLSSVLSKLVAESGKASLGANASGLASADPEEHKEKRRKVTSLDEAVAGSLTGFEPSYISPPPPARHQQPPMMGGVGRGPALGASQPQIGGNILPLGWPPGAPPPAYAPYQPGPPLGYYNQPPSSSMQ